MRGLCAYRYRQDGQEGPGTLANPSEDDGGSEIALRNHATRTVRASLGTSHSTVLRDRNQLIQVNELPPAEKVRGPDHLRRTTDRGIIVSSFE